MPSILNPLRLLLAAALVLLASCVHQDLKATPSETQGSFESKAPRRSVTNATISGPRNGCMVKITKVEQRVTGGGWFDITEEVTRNRNPSNQPELTFPEPVGNRTFRFTYEVSGDLPGGFRFETKVVWT